ncbi:hypothetical protein [Thermodesulfobacterium hydrogeniphilum]|uniref:hypothetical protein n=1 Tax=Thermodesulfobacterium hydrogeniphilum TaxID=161156 RepID=UPI000570C5FB|nr:hypothetical protein [Thermodesulfobacterium hydrogeniphilum]
MKKNNTGKLTGGDKMRLFILAIIFVLVFNTSLLAKKESSKETKICFRVKKELFAEPDFLLLNISIEAKADEEKDVLNALALADKRIKNTQIKYEGGKYNIRKNCFWKRNEWICKEFIGNANYNFKLKSPEKQNIILETLETDPKPYTYFINYLRWTISKNKEKYIEDKLFSAIFDEVLRKKELIESKLNTKCYIKKIDFIKRYYPVRMNMIAEKLNKSVVEAPMPQKEKLNFYKAAEIEIRCEE